MGISTICSYRGAQLFEAIGLSSTLIETYFKGTVSKIEGIDINELVADILLSHQAAYSADFKTDSPLRHDGIYTYRKDGEYHAWNPETIAT